MCDRPALARLTNGRTLVVGNDALYEIDTRRAKASTKVELSLPRCRAAAVVRHDGTVLLIGGEDTITDAPSDTAELYDPETRTSKRWSLVDDSGPQSTAPPEGVTLGWFDMPMVFGVASGAGARVSYQEAALRPFFGGYGSFTSVHLTAEGSWLGAGSGLPSLFGVGSSAAVAEYPAGRELTMGTDVDFDAAFPGHPYPGRAPEGSSGTTQSSPANLPIPVWFPAEGGWPSMGTLIRLGTTTTYRVPTTPFPGLGLLFLATNGNLTPLGPVTIARAEQGAECGNGGECESGYCVDGVCCDQTCDGTCEACSKAKKGGGKDGECKPVAAGTPDSACANDRASCGENGTCDGSGQCALYPDGSNCAPNAKCSGGYCVVREPTPNNDGDGAAGSGGAAPDGAGASGGTRNDTPTPRSSCTDDEQIVSPEGTLVVDCKPYRCRNAECARSCASSRDCADGFACDPSGRCVTPVSQRAKSVGCGCNVPRYSGTHATTAAALLALLAWIRRRRARPNCAAVCATPLS